MKPILVLLLTLLPVAAEFRNWRNTEGTKNIPGQFVKRDSESLTIMRRDRKPLTLKLDQIHPEDVLWLNKNHPLQSPVTATPATGVLDQLQFGDSRTEVTAKLQKSRMFEATVAETFFGRTGLNGIFKSRETIGGMHGFLYFDWEENGGLSKITLQTEPKDPTAWASTLKPCMDEFVKLLNSLYGKGQAASRKTDPLTMTDGMMMADYVWKLQPSGSVLLGPSRMDGKLQIAVRFTTEEVDMQTTE